MELKPCPFCGDKLRIGRFNRVRCLSCYAQSGIRYYSAEEAAEAWNTRDFDRTPEREHAEEMRELLREVVVGVNTDESCTCYICKAARVLATITAAERENDDK